MRELFLFCTAALVTIAACGGGKNKPPDAAAGAGGHSGAGGNSTCPATPPAAGAACTGTAICSYEDRCNSCGACCSFAYACSNGGYVYYGANDACITVLCEDAGAGGMGGGAGTRDGGGLTDCPAERPADGTPCSGYFICKYPETCRCDVCCSFTHRCDNGSFIDLGISSECYFVTCPDAGAVCRPGNNATCNDSPNWAGIYGRCTDAGTCECFDSGVNPDSGRCNMAVPRP